MQSPILIAPLSYGWSDEHPGRGIGLRTRCGVQRAHCPTWARTEALTHLRDVLEMLRSKETRSNSMRQAQAPLTRVSLVPHGRGMLLEIADDGVDFDAEHVKGDSLGLHNLCSRAQNIGTQVEILSKPGEGTRIVAEIRFPDDNR